MLHCHTHSKKGLEVNRPVPKRLELSTSGKKHFVKYDDIMHIEACGSYSTIFLKSGKRLTISKNLKKVERMLDDEMFFRVHNSQIVHLSKIHTCN